MVQDYSKTNGVKCSFFLSCPTPLENEDDDVAGLHSACRRAFVVNQSSQSQRHKGIPELDVRRGYLQLQHRAVINSDCNYPKGLLREGIVTSLVHKTLK